ncbi:MAG: retron Ec67 family RNA-directed DNA polymerase/endonuclease [Acutalibacteraceae bacterium]
MEKLSNIKTRNELAVHLGISKRQLTYILYVRKVESFYHTFSISKKSGGIRTICAPQGRLKILQKKILCLLTEHVSELNQKRYNKVSHAFEKGKGIISNSKVHRNKRFVINIDLEHFFDSFHFGRVCGYFEKNRDFQLAHNVALDLARLLCYRGCLPQGAPTSPIVANLICQTLDMHLLQISKKYHLDYTRYADDLTFSTNDKNFLKLQEDFIKELQQEILRSGFRINSNKTRLQYRESQQKVTGLVVNKKINVARDYYKQTRAMADKLYKDGVFYINEKRGTIGQLEGRFSFIDQLCKYNNKQDHQKHTFRNLNGREEEYRKFLFYKYFFTVISL